MVPTDGASDAEGLAALAAAQPAVVAQPTAMRVADALRERISQGLFPPGSRLPEEAIGRALGVSRNTVREAFIQLAAERLVVREPHRGVFVATLDERAVRDIYRARRIIEIGALHNVVDTTPVGAARAAVTAGIRARAERDLPGVTTANQHFHRSIVALAASATLDRAMAHLQAQIRLAMHRAAGRPDFPEAYVDENDRLCTLLEAGRFPDAAAAMLRYLARSEQEVLEAAAPGHPRP